MNFFKLIEINLNELNYLNIYRQFHLNFKKELEKIAKKNEKFFGTVFSSEMNTIKSLILTY